MGPRGRGIGSRMFAKDGEESYSHTWVGILPGYFRCLYSGHARCRHAGTFTSPYYYSILQYALPDRRIFVGRYLCMLLLSTRPI